MYLSCEVVPIQTHFSPTILRELGQSKQTLGRLYLYRVKKHVYFFSSVGDTCSITSQCSPLIISCRLKKFYGLLFIGALNTLLTLNIGILYSFSNAQNSSYHELVTATTVNKYFS